MLGTGDVKRGVYIKAVYPAPNCYSSITIGSLSREKLP
uniref:Uncharacterized protein n=1 Tax=Moniliophthora roreri TaxID=221103 RepID=A0A0W0FY93_MONRR